jgi:pyridoxal phosphate enzyme (YggS family)
MRHIGSNIAEVRKRIAAACASAGRPADDVRLLAVSKTFGPDEILAALAAGQCEFGENYVQEAVEKMSHVPRAGIAWHYIGPIQSNKTRAIAEAFDWVHGIDRLKIAQRLSDQRPATLPRLQVCVQVNISGEASKSGCAPTETAALCSAIAAMPRLALRGLMAIPAPASVEDPRAAYSRLRDLFDALRRSGMQLDTLSAGMSDDLEAAIAAGSTLVRIGTAIFGKRT